MLIMPLLVLLATMDSRERSIGTRPDAELVNSMLDAAIEMVADINAQPVLHSDRGAHYRWPGWLSRSPLEYRESLGLAA
ncbi:hypothetical protein LMG24076_01960 [Trinickia soli]|nr:hypothetical protein LMG24076_01960 [Trinickia soli]